LLRQGSLRDDEISINAVRSYALVEFQHQVEDGGFAQFAYNMGAEDDAIAVVREALAAVGARAILAAFKAGEALLANLTEEQRSDFFNGEYFGENEIRDKL